MVNLDVDLGKRQQEIAEHIAFGYSIKETADILDTPINTVKATLKAIYSKLGIQKATELAKYIYCRSLVCLWLYANLLERLLRPVFSSWFFIPYTNMMKVCIQDGRDVQLALKE